MNSAPLLCNIICNAKTWTVKNRDRPDGRSLLFVRVLSRNYFWVAYWKKK